jgi:TRAP-type C4-dicarboxylate transport system permease small subunit
MSKMFARTLKILVAFFRLVFTFAPLLILAGVCLGLLYFGCMAMQPWVESVLPVRVVPTGGHNWPWLFIYVLLIVAFAWMFLAALANEMKEIPGRPLRRFGLGLWALVRSMRQRNYRLDRAVVGAICSRPPKLRA